MESNDIMEKVDGEAKKIKSTVNSENIKVFEKYHDLSVKELQKLLAQKNGDLIRLNTEKEKSKNVLKDIIIKLNETIKENSDFLYDDDADTDLIENLEKVVEEKKRQLDNSKKIKNVFKEQLNSIKGKITLDEKEKKKASLIDDKIDFLKKRNVSIQKEINEIKSKRLYRKKNWK